MTHHYPDSSTGVGTAGSRTRSRLIDGRLSSNHDDYNIITLDRKKRKEKRAAAARRRRRSKTMNDPGLYRQVAQVLRQVRHLGDRDGEAAPHGWTHTGVQDIMIFITLCSWWWLMMTTHTGIEYMLKKSALTDSSRTAYGLVTMTHYWRWRWQWRRSYWHYHHSSYSYISSS